MTPVPRATKVPMQGAWYALAILCAAAVFSQLDRQLTAVIIRPLKEHFSLSDTQFSLLHGYAFAVTYSLFAFPLGRLVDRSNRRNLMFFGMLLWCALTALAAFSNSFSQLVVARVGVGIGEAVLAPAAYSLIADYFPVERRGRAVGIYYMGLSVGGGMSLVLGGLILKLLPAGGLSVVGQMLEPWRLVFLLVGAPGILIAFLILTIREPARQGSVTTTHDATASADTSAFAVLGYIWRHRSTIFPIYFASALMAGIGYGVFAWAPALFDRQFGIGPAQSTLPLGLLMTVGSCTGPLLSGWLSDRWVMRGQANPRLQVMFVAYVALIPFSVWAIVPWPWVSYVLVGALTFCVGLLQAAMPVALQEAVPENMRGQVIALQYLVLGLVGFGAGPTVVALLTDQVFGSDAMLRWSLLCIGLPGALLGVLICRWGLRAKGKSLQIA